MVVVEALLEVFGCNLPSYVLEGMPDRKYCKDARDRSAIMVKLNLAPKSCLCTVLLT